MNREQIEKMIRMFEAMRQRPGMYFGALEAITIQNWLFGFYCAFHLMGIDTIKNETLWKSLIKKHGLDHPSAASPSFQMENLGYDGERIIDETLALEIEYWQRILAEVEDENSDG